MSPDCAVEMRITYNGNDVYDDVYDASSNTYTQRMYGFPYERTIELDYYISNFQIDDILRAKGKLLFYNIRGGKIEELINDDDEAYKANPY